MHTIKTAGIENVRQLCGHASIASTGYYLKVSDATAWAALGSGQAYRELA
jgi:site-specific recombinase XerD